MALMHLVAPAVGGLLSSIGKSSREAVCVLTAHIEPARLNLELDGDKSLPLRQYMILEIPHRDQTLA